MSFVLGRETAKASQIELPVEVFRRHFVVLGPSGSGKTVLCKCVIEEAVRNGVPVLIVDTQGDLASLALKGDPEKIRRHGIPLEIQEEFFQKARVSIFTPASTKTIPISINPLKFPPNGTSNEDAILSLDLTAASLTSFLGYNLDSDPGRETKAYLFSILQYSWQEGQTIENMDRMADIILAPPEKIARPLRDLVTKKRPLEIARKLRFLAVGARSLMFQMGVQIDIDMFMDQSDGKVPVNILYLNTLRSAEDRQFFLTMLIKEIYCCMLKNQSKNVQLIFYVDEIAPYIPPHPRNPPSKEAYTLLFRQARKYGIGLVAATQNVTDIDYKALAQVNTWCFGRSMLSRDIASLRKMMPQGDHAYASRVLKDLQSLSPGEFLLLSPDVYDNIKRFRVRYLVTEHLTLDEKDLPQCLSQESLKFFKKYAPTGPGKQQQITYRSIAEEICRKYRLRLISSDFIDRVKSLATSPQGFYGLADPSWSDIINDFDVIRTIQGQILNELDEHGNEPIFLPILAPSCEGKSTFLRRLAYELYLRNELVFYLEIEPSIWNINIEQLTFDLKELSKAENKTIYLLVDNCFRSRLEILISSIANESFSISVVGTSQPREYRDNVQKYEQTILEKGKPFHLPPLDKQEISSLIEKLIRHKIIEPPSSITRETLLNKCESKAYLSELIQELVPQNRFSVRTKEMIEKIRGSEAVYTTWKYVSLAYQFGLAIPLATLARLIHQNDEEIVAEIGRSCEDELLIFSVKDVYFVRLRHEKWATESVKLLFPKGVGIVRRYETLVDSIDETSPSERGFIANLLTKLAALGQKETARRVYFSHSFLNKSKSIEKQLSLKEHLEDWIGLHLALRNGTLEDIKLVRRLLRVASRNNPQDPELYFKRKYLMFLESKFKGQYDLVARKFIDNSDVPSKISKELLSPEGNHQLLYEVLLKKLSFQPRYSSLVASFLGLLGVIGRRQEMKEIVDNLELPPTGDFLYRKAAFYFENDEYEKAQGVFTSGLGLYPEYKQLKQSYTRFLLHYDFDLALREIENGEKIHPGRAFFLRAELYLIHSRTAELEALWKSYNPRTKGSIFKYIWYTASLAFLGKYSKAKNLLDRLYVKIGTGTEKYYEQQARYLSVVFYYLGKFFAQEPDKLTHAYKWLELSRRLATRKWLYTFRIDAEIDSLNNGLVKSLQSMGSKDKLIGIAIIVARKYKSIIPDRFRDKLLSELKSFCKQRIEESRDDFEIRFWYAQILDLIGHKARARKQFAKALELNPNHAEINNQFANFLKDSVHDYAGAEAYYRKAMDCKRNNPKYLNNLAMLFIDTKQVEKFDEAEDLLQEAMKKKNFEYAKINMDRLKTIRNSLTDK